MQTVTYRSVLDLAASLMGADPDRLDVRLAASLNKFINRALREVWERFRWPDLCPIEERLFRPEYDNAAAYTATQERFYRPTKKYYQALQSTTGNAPADANGVENSAYWAESAGSYSADDYLATKAYTVGERAYYPTTGRYYQRHTASGAGVLPTDTAAWGVLTPFQRTIDLVSTGQTTIGEVLEVLDADPRVNTRACKLKHELEPDKVLVRGTPTIVWVRFRKRRPILSGANYSSSATYSNGTTIFFTDGDFWTASDSPSAGQSPASHPAKWTKLEFPYVLQEVVAQWAYALQLKADGENEKYDLEFAEANRLLRGEFDKVERQQGQTRQLNVQVRV